MRVQHRRAADLPTVTDEEMAAVDRVMFEELGLAVLQVMEEAGRAVAAFARERFLGGDPRGTQVLVLAGGGGNGGDGLVAARYLHGWGATVRVLVSRAPGELGELAAHQARILECLGLTLGAPGGEGWPGAPPRPADLTIDALLGFGLRRAPEGATAALIAVANGGSGPVLAVDVPSGLDATGGTAFEPTVRATATVTLGLPKTGLLAQSARDGVGELWVADIGVPAAAYARIGREVGPVFATADVIRVNLGDEGRGTRDETAAG